MTVSFSFCLISSSEVFLREAGSGMHSYWTLQAESLLPFAFSKSLSKHLPASS